MTYYIDTLNVCMYYIHTLNPKHTTVTPMYLTEIAFRRDIHPHSISQDSIGYSALTNNSKVSRVSYNKGLSFSFPTKYKWQFYL